MTTYSQGLRLAEPTPGDPAVANIWGTILNTNFTLIDTSITGTLSLDVSGGSNVVLTANNGSPDQSRNANFVFTGALTGNIYVLFPEGGAGSFSVQNATTGGFSLSIAVNNGSSAPVGASVTVPQNGTLELVSDGTDVRNRVDIIGLGAAASGANSDITSLSGLTTPLSPAQGGTGNSSGQPSGAAGGDLTGTYPNPSIGENVRNFFSTVFTSSGTFTIPPKASTSTSFKFIVVGGGGGGGKAVDSTHGVGAGGGAGGAIEAVYSGFVSGATVTIVVGSGGGSGSAGSSSSVIYGGITIANANGGGAGGNSTNTGAGYLANPGIAGGASASSGGSGLSLASSTPLMSSSGAAGISSGTSLGYSGAGGASCLGGGGYPVITGPTDGVSGGIGAGGSGGAWSLVGGNGGNGEVIIEWVL